MPCAPILRFGDRGAEECKTEAGEVMSGVLEILRGSNLSGAFSQSPKPKRVGGYSTSREVGLIADSQRVFVKIYRTSSEHFAVIYPIRAIVTACRPLASLNLRSCSVKTHNSNSGREFRVSPRSCEGVTVTFRALESSSELQISDWLQAFTDVPESSQRRKKVSDHRSPLPVLEEREEDASEDQD